MDTKIHIICDSADNTDLKNFCARLKDAGIETDVIYLYEDGSGYDDGCNVSLALLWISSNSKNLLFNLAQERNKRTLPTINFFSDARALNDSERTAVGQNTSVFAEVTPNGYLEELIELFGKIKPEELMEAPKHKLTQNTTNPVSEISTLSSISEGLKDQPTPNSNLQGNTDEEHVEEETPDNKKVLWMPWVWMGMLLLLEILVKTETYVAYSNEVGFLVVGLLYMYFPYKSLRASLKAIKVQKWEYVTLVISIALIIYYVPVSFRFIGIYFD